MAEWKPIKDQGAGYAYHLSQSLALLEWRNPRVLTAVNDGDLLLISDYSGQHKNASHEAYSFLVTTHKSLQDWIERRSQFRKNWLKDGRRISFKQLREPARWNALAPFLSTANCIEGNVITFLIDQRVGSFMNGGASTIQEVFPDCFSANTKHGTTEKMFRLASFVSLLLAGLRQEQQRSIWFSDHDETLSTSPRREEFARLAYYLTLGFTRWKNPADVEFATTDSACLPVWAEDLASVPDLIAGTSCHLNSILPSCFGTETWTASVKPTHQIDRRALAIVNWMARGEGKLKFVLCRLELNPQGEPRCSAQAFSQTKTRSVSAIF